ncbi:DNA gyrase inhibitor YacG [Hydrogenophaga crassostreae]|uniref:DNA gyrase inhibitor YacG n=1 Tax=Hydrogenophaga crassostreae TaxID=1763535 RepID=UPI0009EE3675|nr:DNA gyrase inhibitor YacG [Hydrogenophaga crassostreae]
MPQATYPEPEARTVPCPHCGGPSPYASSNESRPFCSARCKNIDFGAWASEQFSLPEETPNNDPDFENS